MDTAWLQRASAEEASASAVADDHIELRTPEVGDGRAVHALIRACPPLDENSAYCNLLQCAHFAGTCVVAARDDRLVGWLSGYRPPDDQGAIFVWQVAVAPQARGLGLGARMLGELLSRPACRGVRRLKTTITEGNTASWRLFGRLANRLGAPLTRNPWFVEDVHLPAGHATEHLVTIGPFAAATGRL